MNVLSTARRGHPGLYWWAVAMAALAVVLAVAAVVDQRTLMGAPLWFKPLKFAVSFVAYGGALAWMLGQLRVPALRRTGWVIVAASAVEMAVIVGQAARGVRSHFNDDTVGDQLLFGLMGATIVVLYLATAAIALRFLREPGRDRAAGTAIRLGLLVGLVGLGVGFVMSAIGSHAVGVADGGPGLPFVGWSTTGGDLRVAHFVGMHALQALPLLAAALAATGRFTEEARTRAVTVAALTYGAVVLLLTWQALRGQPLLAPDALTLGTLAVVVLGAAGALATGRERVPR
ncbi:hypothetical protein [Pseudonocardia broussonetiae]|uniref:Uncharacterized protein n=1 Tax=Pseudonocardia broussonetiae TaxID=2736640 RepID=A0A6M6JH54_9PSEU|nr:hypothetical protein [Pseudonocardia broussonetiae]QJY47358.1 hypothetical protein HOP40_17365 [Pseudonocardia broussonetiae]